MGSYLNFDVLFGPKAELEAIRSMINFQNRISLVYTNLSERSRDTSLPDNQRRSNNVSSQVNLRDESNATQETTPPSGCND